MNPRRLDTITAIGCIVATVIIVVIFYMAARPLTCAHIAGQTMDRTSTVTYPPEEHCR